MSVCSWQKQRLTLKGQIAIASSATLTRFAIQVVRTDDAWMAYLTTAQKVDRATRLLLGLRRRVVAGALEEHGFAATDIDEGFRLLRALTVSDVRGAAQKDEPAARAERTAEWASRWLPIARAALRRQHPQILARLFKATPHAKREPGHYERVHTFIARYDDLRKSKGPEVAAALALLRQRGLVDARIEEARALLDVPRATPWEPGDFTKAEAALWDWYLEWSAVVRARVKDLRLLRELGLRAKSGASDEADVES